MTPRSSLRPLDVVIRIAIVGLVLGTAYIHSTLGGLLFTLNALGYLVAAVAIVIPLGARRPLPLVHPPRPHGLRRHRDPRAGRSRARTTRPPTSPRRIEVALIALLAIDFARMDGNPINGRQERARPARLEARPPPATGQAGA